MPIPTAQWKTLIANSLRRLSDREYQNLSWFNKHPEQTSPDEQICQILDDYGFEDFIRSPEIDLSAAQRLLALALVEKLKRYGRPDHGHVDSKKVIDDPEWNSIRADSKRVLSILFSDLQGKSGSE